MRKNGRIGVLVAAMVIQLCAGIIYMWSVFKDPVTAHLNWDGAAAALTSSIMLAAFVAGIAFGGRLQDKIGPKVVCLGGSALISVGMVLTAFVPASTPALIYLTYGILGGVGVGAVYTSTLSCVQKWFPDKRGFATGMAVSAFGFSLVLFAPLGRTMLSQLGVQNTFLIFGVGFFIVCTLASLWIKNPPEGYQPAGFKPGGKANVTARQYTTREMLATRQFYLLTLSMFFTLPAYFILNPLLMTLGVERGLSESLALAGVMITGVMSAAGRLTITWLSDLVGRKPAMFFVSGLTLVAALLMIGAQGAFFLVCIAFIAFAYGGSSGVYSAATADSFGTKHAGSNFGCVMVGFGLSSLIFPFVASKISAGGDYTLSFIIAAVTCAVALLLIALYQKPGKAS